MWVGAGVAFIVSGLAVGIVNGWFSLGFVGCAYVCLRLASLRARKVFANG